jgi:hypothetical protein
VAFKRLWACTERGSSPFGGESMVPEGSVGWKVSSKRTPNRFRRAACLCTAAALQRLPMTATFRHRTGRSMLPAWSRPPPPIFGVHIAFDCLLAGDGSTCSCLLRGHSKGGPSHARRILLLLLSCLRRSACVYGRLWRRAAPGFFYWLINTSCTSANQRDHCALSPDDRPSYCFTSTGWRGLPSHLDIPLFWAPGSVM